MLKSFNLTDIDIQRINELKAHTGAGSAREVIRRALEEYHEKILSKIFGIFTTKIFDIFGFKNIVQCSCNLRSVGV